MIIFLLLVLLGLAVVLLQYQQSGLHKIKEELAGLHNELDKVRRELRLLQEKSASATKQAVQPPKETAPLAEELSSRTTWQEGVPAPDASSPELAVAPALAATGEALSKTPLHPQEEAPLSVAPPAPDRATEIPEAPFSRQWADETVLEAPPRPGTVPDSAEEPLLPDDSPIFAANADIPDIPAPAAARPALHSEAAKSAEAAESAKAEQEAPCEATPLSPLVSALAELWAWLKLNPLLFGGLSVFLMGVAFALGYLVTHSYISPAMRLLAIGTGGAAMQALGWRLLDKKRLFGLGLVGGGSVVLYFTLFAAYRLALLPPLLALLLLIALVLETCALALWADAQVLAVIATAGAISAPLLIDTGSKDFAALFGYYALLSAGATALAARRNWDIPILVACAAVYGIGGFWGALFYQPGLLIAAETFLALFFVIFSAAHLFLAANADAAEEAARPGRARRFVHASLLCGVPLLTFTYHYWLVRPLEYTGVGGALILSACELALFWKLRSKDGPAMRLTRDALLVIGLAFLILAAPLALNATWTTCTWSLQGLACFWLGIRQERPFLRALGYGMQLLAALALLVHLPETALSSRRACEVVLAFSACCLLGFCHWGRAGLNALEERHLAFGQSWALTCWFWAGADLLSGWFWADANILHLWLRYLDLILFLAAVVYLIGKIKWGWHFVPVLLPLYFLWLLWCTPATPRTYANALLVLLAASCLIWTQAGKRLDWRVCASSCVILPFAWLATQGGHATILVPFLPVFDTVHPQAVAPLAWATGGLFALPLAWFTFVRCFGHSLWPESPQHRSALAVFALLSALAPTLLSLQVWLGNVFAAPLQAALLTVLVWVLQRPNLPPLPAGFAPPLNLDPDAFRRWTGGFAACALALWFLILCSRFDALSWPYVPLVYPLDAAQICCLVGLFFWQRQEAALGESLRPLVLPVQALAAFALVNVLVARCVCAATGCPYSPGPLLRSPAFLTTLSLLWGGISLCLMIVASHLRKSRRLWFCGLSLLALTLIKLVFLDLSDQETLHRSLSFLAVGLLMLVMGYFCPLPPKKGEGEGERGVRSEE